MVFQTEEVEPLVHGFLGDLDKLNIQIVRTIYDPRDYVQQPIKSIDYGSDDSFNNYIG